MATMPLVNMVSFGLRIVLAMRPFRLNSFCLCSRVCNCVLVWTICISHIRYDSMPQALNERLESQRLQSRKCLCRSFWACSVNSQACHLCQQRPVLSLMPLNGRVFFYLFILILFISNRKNKHKSNVNLLFGDIIFTIWVFDGDYKFVFWIELNVSFN